MLKIFNITDDFSLLSVAAQKEIKRADKVFLQSEQVACLQDVRALNPTTEVLDRFFEQSADFSQLCADIAEYVAGNAQQNTVFLCLGGTIGSQIVSALRKRMPVEILTGADGYARMAALPEVRMVLSAQVGAAGLAGTLAAALAGKVIALANKESLVLAGDLLRRVCTARGAVILPVDSEHNALFQCLAGRGQDARELILTASGGPFRGRRREDLLHVTREQALKHPNWSMGAKITIDSATMMNKALEVVEAYHLYGIPAGALRVAVHPQSVIHSLVRFRDGGLLAQMGPADMRLPIGHCLLWPECLSVNASGLDLFACGPLEFQEPDPEAFPAVSLAWRALERRGGACVVMNAANEAAVDLFLNGQCGFTDIADIIAEVMDIHEHGIASRQPWSLPDPSASPETTAAHACEAMERIIHLDQQSRALARRLARAGVDEC